MRAEVAAISDAGLVRTENEDNLYLNSNEIKKCNQLHYEYYAEHRIDSHAVYAVFDGIGGLSYGEIASYTASEQLYRIREKVKEIDSVFHELNSAVCEKQLEYQCEMGTTAAIVFLSDEGAVSANVGDSRVYYFREGSLVQLSRDHTERNSALNMQNYIKDRNTIYIDNIKDSLTQYLGIEEDEFILEPEIRKIDKLRAEDIFLVCSDGLCNCVSEEQMKYILEQDENLYKKIIMLQEKAFQAGGKDNITIILIKIK